MKIIKEGVLNKPKATWWDGKILVCSSCGAEVEVDANDEEKLHIISVRCPGGGGKVSMPCITPDCSGSLVYSSIPSIYNR